LSDIKARRVQIACMADDRNPPADDVPALIAHVVERFHETHRRELRTLSALAREPGARGGDLAEHLAAMTTALELHMFKEEMRLFPLMEQGGGALIGLLIDDLERDHRAHEQAISRLEALSSGLAATPEGAGAADALRAGVNKLVADLRAHMRLEDEVLFRRFSAAPRTHA
jgi:regulator of cell morphogenesis and NO signaling